VSQPTPYAPAHSFVSDASTLANFPGQSLDIEFQNVKTTTDQIRTNLALVQPDDGALANSSVTFDQLSPTLQTNGLATASAWLTAINYSAGTTVYQNFNLYRCLVAHTSGVFATDLAAAKWLLLVALPAGPTGPSGTASIGTTATLAAGAAATVTNTGTPQAGVFNFGIPQGVIGNTGPAAWSAPVAWVTSTAYVAGPPVSVVTFGGETYVCLVSHTSGTFATDLAAAKWIKVAQKGTGDLISTNNLSDITNAATARTNLAVPGLSTSNVYTKQETSTLQTLTDAASITWDVSQGQKAKVTLGGNRTMAAITNAVEGTTYFLWAIQDGTGSRTLAYTTAGAGSFDFGISGVPVLTTTASKADLLCFEAISIAGTLKLRFAGAKFGFA
jgi:hypothetical protein